MTAQGTDALFCGTDKSARAYFDRFSISLKDQIARGQSNRDWENWDRKNKY